jgi:hypothetical protein
MMFATSAFADNALAPLHLSHDCESKITRSVYAKCNHDSRKDESREHSCFSDTVRIMRNQYDSAYFETLFTVADAIVYSYGVSIRSKDRCDFIVVSRNN